MSVTFLDETEVCERAVRRLARSRNVTVNYTDGVWLYNDVELNSDEVYDVLSAMPQTNTVRFGLL